MVGPMIVQTTSDTRTKLIGNDKLIEHCREYVGGILDDSVLYHTGTLYNVHCTYCTTADQGLTDLKI